MNGRGLHNVYSRYHCYTPIIEPEDPDLLYFYNIDFVQSRIKSVLRQGHGITDPNKPVAQVTLLLEVPLVSHEERAFERMLSEGVEIAIARRIELLPSARELYEGIDVLLTPSAPFVAPATTPPIDTPEGAVEGIYTSPFNITGDPAISIPCGMSSSGLPIGLQLATAKGSDMRLLSIALAVEELLNFRAPLKN